MEDGTKDAEAFAHIKNDGVIVDNKNINDILRITNKSIDIAKNIDPVAFYTINFKKIKFAIDGTKISVILVYPDDECFCEELEHYIDIDFEDLVNPLDITIAKYEKIKHDAEVIRLAEVKRLKENFENIRNKCFDERSEYERLKAKYENDGIDNGLHQK